MSTPATSVHRPPAGVRAGVEKRQEADRHAFLEPLFDEADSAHFDQPRDRRRRARYEPAGNRDDESVIALTRVAPRSIRRSASRICVPDAPEISTARLDRDAGR